MPPRVTKRAKRTIRRVAAKWRELIRNSAPPQLRKRAAPAVRYIDMLLLDHLAVRLLFPNRHRLSPEAWRSAQPLPHHIRRFARMGVRTIVNLRGKSSSATYRLEEAECARAGIKLVDFRIRSRAAPSREELLAARELFANVEYPIVLHCKSGADRVGLISALYLHVRNGLPIAEARNALSLRYGHIRQADTGILDFFFDRYLAYNEKNPISFFEWVETRYDPLVLRRSFHAKGWANRLVDKVLRRE